MAIQILPEQVANQIAAGEVVEGPSSVVKELVENSIDAGATRISVDINNQLRDIRVADDGSGMSAEDLKLAFKAHATSKIFTLSDLYSLITNGFRGEALASIASVSKLTCITKRAEDKQASKLYLESGIEELSTAGASTGTSIEISELFFNTPVRMKFLKSSSRERNEIIDIMRAFALARPEIAFTLKIDNKVQVETKPYLLRHPEQVQRHPEQAQRHPERSEGSPNGKSTLVDIFGKELESQLLPLSLERGDIHVSGFISSTSYYRSDRRGIFTLLNNRVIRCPVLRSSVDAVYKQYHQPGRHPVVLLRVDMPAADVDVNVHPNKREVKYKNSNQVYTAVGDAIAKALADASYASAGTRQISLGQYELCHPERSEGSQNGALEFDSAKTSLMAPFCSPSRSEGSFGNGAGILRYAQNDSPEHSFSTLSAPQDFDSYSEPRTTSPSRSFISRLGAVDISIVDTINHKTLVSTQGNKTTFEIVATANSKTVICRGDFVGENWLKDKYLKFVYELAYEVLESEANKTGTISTRSRPARNPAKSVLEQLWARDNYTCVYCCKILLHPNTASKAKSECTDSNAFRKYINAQGEEATVNVFDEHTATYDHVLPASKYAELNIDDRNLVTACLECNKQKSDSLATNTWLEKAAANQDYNAWAEINEKNPLVLAGVKFIQADN
jgi:DNA mismatch repair protein MutL